MRAGPLKIVPVEHFRQGLDCGGGSRPDGFTDACNYILRFWITVNGKCPSGSITWKGIRGPSWARTSDLLIMSFFISIYYLLRNTLEI